MNFRNLLKISEEVSPFGKNAFEDQKRAMLQHGACWMASVRTDGCTKHRAETIAAIAIDVALVGLQLTVYPQYRRYISRADAWRLALSTTNISRKNGKLSISLLNNNMGIFTSDWLRKFLVDGQIILDTVGNRIEFCVNADDRLPFLNQAWIDAAHWYHEALSEALDTVATTKLVASIEILFRAESSPKSKKQMIRALKAFWKMEAQDLLIPDWGITVEKFSGDISIERSRVLHGTWSTIDKQGLSNRSPLSSIVAGLLTEYSQSLDLYVEHPGAKDDIEEFMSFVENLA